MDIKQYVKNEIESSLRKTYPDMDFDLNVQIEYPKDKNHGDFSTNTALTLTKKLKKNPRHIAAEIKDNITDEKSLFHNIEIAGPGFINFYISSSYYTNLIKEILRKQDSYGKNDIGSGKKIQVEFVSSNPTGPLHVGHGRQAILGDVLSSVLEWNGYSVTREYYYNNAGNQMNNLGMSVYLRYIELFGKKIELDENHYQGKYIIDIAEKLKEKFNDQYLEKNEENLKFIREFASEIIIRKIDDDLKKLGIKFDVYYLESSLFEERKVDETVEILQNKGFIYEKDNAVWLKTTAIDDTRDRVIYKSDGAATYLLSDIAYHREKLRRGFDSVINIHGADHQGQVASMKSALKMLGYDDSKIVYLVHQMVKFIKDGEEKKMSTRKAQFITISDLVDELGKNVVRYFYIMRSYDSQLVFDFDFAKEQSSENPAYYIQYAHARIYNIIHNELNTVSVDGIFDGLNDINLDLLKNESEIDLIKELYKFPETIEHIGRTYEVHKLTAYLHGIAGKFHNFYHENRVLVDNKELSKARLALCSAAQITLKNGLQILGIDAPNKM